MPRCDSAMVSRVIEFGNNLTASFCDDRWKQEIPNEPKLRPICRFILTFTTGYLLLSATVLLFQYRTDSFRSVRYLGKELLPTIYNRRLHVSASQNLLPSSEKLLCPCTYPNRNSSLMKIFLLSNNSDQFGKYLINDSHDFCWIEWQHIPSSSYLYWACPVMVESVLTTGTQFLSSTLLDQDSLVITLANALNQSVKSIENSYRLLLNLNVTEWWKVEELGAAFLGMTELFRENSSSSEEDYWNAFRSRTAPGGRTLHDVLVGRALTLELNWTAYLEQCSPVFCDEVIRNSVLSRLLSIVAQLGGLISALLFVVRSGVWPGVRWLGGWSSEAIRSTRTDVNPYNHMSL